MESSLTIVGVILGIIVSLITIITVVWKGGELAQTVKQLKDHCDKCEIKEIVKEVAGIKKQNEMFWQMMTPHLASAIHSPIHKRRDALVDKLVENNITWEELVELEPMLCEEAWRGEKEKKVNAAMLHFRVKMLLMKGE